MSANTAPVLTEITNFLLETLRSTDARRFAIVHRVSRTATKFIQATSLRAEDFEDTEQLSKRRGPLYFKDHDHDTTPRVMVPEELAPTSTAVLVAMTEAIAAQLQTERAHRFREAERLAECALNFIASVLPATKGESKGQTEGVIVCDNPEEDYVNQAEFRQPRDTNQLRREILEIEGTDSQIRAELALAKIATDEAAELSHLIAVQGTGVADLIGPIADRIAQLRAKIAFRSKGENAVVSANVPRGHQPRGEGTGKDPAPRDAHAAEREAGARRVA